MREFFNLHDWLFKIVLLFVIAGVVSLLEWVFYKRLLPRFRRKKYVWRKSFLHALHHPFQVYVWVLFATAAFSILAHQFSVKTDLSDYLGPTQRLITLIFIFWFTMRFIRTLEEGLDNRVLEGASKISDRTSVHAIAQLVRVTIIIIILLILLQTMGIKMSALLAFGGVGAAVIGFAAKDTLGNFIGGMMIYWDRPFSVGDWVRSPDRNIEGTVENIGWRLTRIRTFDKRPLYVPNGILSNISLENPSRMTNRRIKVSVGVRYNDANRIASIVKDIEAMLRDHPEIDASQTMFVNLYEFGPSSLNLLVYTFTKTTQWVKYQSIQQDVFLKIIDIITQHGAECAFPTQTVHIPDGVLLPEVKGAMRERNPNKSSNDG